MWSRWRHEQVRRLFGTGRSDFEIAGRTLTFPGSRARRYSWGEAQRVIVQICNAAALVAFPQDGPGRKRARRIALVSDRQSVAIPDEVVGPRC